jgi:hypothetical protein
MNNIIFTGNLDVDKEILYMLDDYDLYNLYYTSKYIRKIILFNRYLQSRFIFFKRHYLEIIQYFKKINRNGEVHIEIRNINHIQLDYCFTRDNILFLLLNANRLEINENNINYDINFQDGLYSIKIIVNLLGYRFDINKITHSINNQTIYTL